MAETIESLFKNLGSFPFTSVRANQYGPTLKPLWKGSLVQFTYEFAKPGHDRTPLIVVTDIMQNYIRGINVHYLTFPVIKNILQVSGMNACNNPNFSYANIKSDRYIISAFRQYKKIGLKRLKILDCSFILNVMGSVRAIDPQEVEAIRNTIREQLNRTINQVVPTVREI